MPDSSRGIFLSYRREDSAPHASSLQLQLSQRLPDTQVFMDLDSIEPGLDFAEVIEEAVNSCAVLVALIGRQWATLADEEGRRRLDDPDDYVRFEVQAALSRRVRVIPVLVDGAKPLRQQQLPAELHKLARLQAHTLSYARYKYDTDQLLDLIERLLATARGTSTAPRSPSAPVREGQASDYVAAPLPMTEQVLGPERPRILAFRGIKDRIAVLGARFSGKTTLINSWRGEWVADEADPGRTQAPSVYSTIKLIVEGVRITFKNVADVSGAINAWPVWEDSTKESKYVLYLVDARALAGNLDRHQGRDWHRLEDDAGLVGSWLREGRPKLCLLVVTHTDEDARREELGEAKYLELVKAQVDPLITKLGGPRKVHIAVGSLKTLRSAEAVTSSIMREIISWEKSR
jgi:GTPase SAR1 family protein